MGVNGEHIKGRSAGAARRVGARVGTLPSLTEVGGIRNRRWGRRAGVVVVDDIVLCGLEDAQVLAGHEATNPADASQVFFVRFNSAAELRKLWHEHST